MLAMSYALAAVLSTLGSALAVASLNTIPVSLFCAAVTVFVFTLPYFIWWCVACGYCTLSLNDLSFRAIAYGESVKERPVYCVS